ncbi:hypothetical protein [Flagellimonas algicola]|uniref:Uncharacterized protein n=1 Tax=Flagellimonas algicola TaxID=2583815 RepID=A0ABY2WP79_9FLAO|nr:hypothetical protein [Allomuricauda algicola]TMU56466.1 hypothetical protein FGG15_02705 [Allomuricauda algicola]
MKNTLTKIEEYIEINLKGFDNKNAASSGYRCALLNIKSIIENDKFDKEGYIEKNLSGFDNENEQGKRPKGPVNAHMFPILDMLCEAAEIAHDIRDFEVVFEEVKGCDRPCGPSDFEPGGKCDKNGFYPNDVNAYGFTDIEHEAVLKLLKQMEKAVCVTYTLADGLEGMPDIQIDKVLFLVIMSAFAKKWDRIHSNVKAS